MEDGRTHGYGSDLEQRMRGSDLEGRVESWRSNLKARLHGSDLARRENWRRSNLAVILFDVAVIRVGNSKAIVGRRHFFELEDIVIITNKTPFCGFIRNVFDFSNQHCRSMTRGKDLAN